MKGESLNPVKSALASGIALTLLYVLYTLLFAAGGFGMMGGGYGMMSGWMMGQSFGAWLFIQGVIFAFITGFVAGGLFAWVYNRLGK